MKKYFLLLLAAVSFLGTFAQETGVSTPYSRYGVGVLNDPSLGFNKGMAGTGIALSDSRRLNFANPASYARFDSLTLASRCKPTTARSATPPTTTIVRSSTISQRVSAWRLVSASV